MLATEHPLTDRAVEILGALVAFDTTSRNTNLPLLDWVETFLRAHDITGMRLVDETGEKANFFATIGPRDVAGIALSGHTDVVPVDGQDWDTDPFALHRAGSRLHGRGACDMKAFLACALAFAPEFARAKLRVPVHLAFSYDEEVGCTGVLPMVQRLGEDLVRPRAVIVGEPTEMMVVDAHKGPCRWRVELKGRAVHSSLANLGVNTITYAGRLIAELDVMEQEFKALTDPRFDPPYTTLQVTQMQAGAASNIVPEDCWFGFEIRGLPSADANAVEARVKTVAARLEAEMRQTAPEAEITVKRTGFVPPFQASEDGEALALALRLAGANETFAVAYATEASHFQAAGMATIVCGPGNIAQAHTPNEWIEVAEIAKCLSFMERLLAWCAAQEPAGR